MAVHAVSVEGLQVAKAAQGLVHGMGSPLAETRRSCGRIAVSDATVLLTGETGTGKEVFARFIHGSSPRATRPFVPVNCGAIPENLLESELFGYVKGAFTGAGSPRKGRVAMAEGGTLFLDEIGELPLGLQVKLLRLLQERTYEPVGSSESLTTNFRLIAATNRDLSVEVKAGRFRSDLYYRLFVCPIRLPALRERTGDVPVLFSHFWRTRGETRPVDPEVLRLLSAYPWPGNVRELENLVERLSVCTEGAVVRVRDLPSDFGGLGVSDSAYPEQAMDDAVSHEIYTPSITSYDPTPTPLVASVPRMPPAAVPPVAYMPPMRVPTPLPMAAAHADDELTPPPLTLPGETLELGSFERPEFPSVRLVLPIDLPTMLRELENAYLDAALEQTGGNKKEAARLLGMGRTTLVEKLRRRGADASKA